MKFQRFYEDNLKMREYFENFQDTRKYPQIPASQIGKAIIYMPAFRLKSLLQVERHPLKVGQARSPVFRNLIESKRFMVASDSTLQRVLPKFTLEPIYDIEKAIYSLIISQGLSKSQISSKKKLRIGIVDGSGFGHHFASVVTLSGKSAFPLGCQEFNKRGKELPASRRVLSQLTKNLGKSFCDILVGDGLYANREDFRSCKEKYGCDLLVKTSEETLDVIQNARGLLFSNSKDIEIATGVDTQRNVFYETKALSDFEWEGLSYPLKVCWVREEKLKPAPDEEPFEEFWVITTRVDLTPEEMRQIAHERWQIENNDFKRLNSLIKSKNVHTHDLSTFKVLLNLWLIGFCPPASGYPRCSFFSLENLTGLLAMVKFALPGTFS